MYDRLVYRGPTSKACPRTISGPPPGFDEAPAAAAIFAVKSEYPLALSLAGPAFAPSAAAGVVLLCSEGDVIVGAHSLARSVVVLGAAWLTPSRLLGVCGEGHMGGALEAGPPSRFAAVGVDSYFFFVQALFKYVLWTFFHTAVDKRNPVYLHAYIIIVMFV